MEWDGIVRGVYSVIDGSDEVMISKLIFAQLFPFELLAHDETVSHNF